MFALPFVVCRFAACRQMAKALCSASETKTETGTGAHDELKVELLSTDATDAVFAFEMLMTADRDGYTYVHRRSERDKTRKGKEKKRLIIEYLLMQCSLCAAYFLGTQIHNGCV